MNLDMEKKGMLPALVGYDPRLKLELPAGMTVEYYGDDILYIGLNGEKVAEIWDRPNIHIKTEKGLEEEMLDMLAWIKEEIKKVKENYPIETWAGRHLNG